MPLLMRLGRHHRDFGYVAWGMVCFIISMVGFWPSYFAPMIARNYQSPSSVMQFHVLFCMAWLVLLVSQPLLIIQGRPRLHRTIGVFGALVALGVVVTGVAVQIDVMPLRAKQGDELNAVGNPFIRLTLLLVYAVCIGLALVARRRIDWHKRLMLIGSFALLQSPVDRMTANVFGLQNIRGLMAVLSNIVLLILFLLWDRHNSGRVHPVTKWATIAIICFVLITPPMSFMRWWHDLAATIAGQ